MIQTFLLSDIETCKQYQCQRVISERLKSGFWLPLNDSYGICHIRFIRCIIVSSFLLIHSSPILELCRNQSRDLQGISNDWLRYDDKVKLKWVKLFLASYRKPSHSNVCVSFASIFLQIHRNRRHMDRACVLKFWETLEK